MAVTNMVGEVIAAFGTDEQRGSISRLTGGDTLGAFALSEADAGSDSGSDPNDRDSSRWRLDSPRVETVDQSWRRVGRDDRMGAHW